MGTMGDQDEEPRHEGARRVSKQMLMEIEDAYDAKANAPDFKQQLHPHGRMPTAKEVKSKAFKQAKEEAEEDAEPRYGGIFKAKELPAVDTKPILDEECHSRCVKPWKEYEKCEARIEKTGEGNCASWYSDHLPRAWVADEPLPHSSTPPS